MKHLLTAALLVSTVALSACAGGSSTAGNSLVEIVKAEKGESLSAPAGCVMPDDVIGKSYTDLPRMKLQGPSRVIFPGATVTGDQVSNRLNFKVDKKGIIRSVTCG